MKTKRIATVLLAGVLAVAAVAAFTACGDSTGTSGSDTYVMEAEYIDLDDVSGAGISSDQSGVDMIYGDGTEAQKELGWSNGYFVGYTYSSNLELNFVFDSDKDATATVILRLGSELGDINLDPTNFSVILNGTEITYSSMYVENSRIDSMKFTDKTVTSSANIKKDENTLTLKEGRLPEKENEILVEYSGIKGGKYKIGDKIVFQKESGNTDLSEQLKTLEFTIVGKVDSPLYISYQRGTTNIGDGSITEFMYIPQQAFDTERYTELYVKSDFSDSVSAFDEEYNTKVENLSETLEKTANARCEYFDTNTIQKAKDEISDSKEELKTEKDKAYKELDDAAKELESSKNTFNNEISSAQAKLDDAKKQIDDGNAEYKKSYDAYYSEIEKAQQTIEQNEKKIKDSQSQYNKAKAEFEEQISSAQKQIDDGLEEYNAAYEQFKNYQEPQLQETINTLKRCTPLERAYFQRFFTFVSKEQILSK